MSVICVCVSEWGASARRRVLELLELQTVRNCTLIFWKRSKSSNSRSHCSLALFLVIWNSLNIARLTSDTICIWVWPWADPLATPEDSRITNLCRILACFFFSHCIAQANLKLRILLPGFLSARITSYRHVAPWPCQDQGTPVYMCVSVCVCVLFCVSLRQGIKSSPSWPWTVSKTGIKSMHHLKCILQ